MWARRPDAAETLAAAHGAPAFDAFAELLDHCDAVAFAVPPDVQAELATQAAQAGKALLLEKPIALHLAEAERLVGVVERVAVATQVNLTWRYTDAARSLLDAVHATEPIGARGWFVSGAFLGGPFATPWRLEHGPLLDLGPHVIDLLDAALGPVVSVRGHGHSRRWVGLLLEHESGRLSEVSLTGHAKVESMRAGVEVCSAAGTFDFDGATAVTADVMPRIVDEFVDAVLGRSPQPIDVHRGLHVQRLVHAALQDLQS